MGPRLFEAARNASLASLDGASAHARGATAAVAADPAGKKADIAKKVTAAIMDATGLGNDDVWVVFEEVNARDWYVGKTDVETLRKG
jgi:4-oxalocrotonate tautomerase